MRLDAWDCGELGRADEVGEISTMAGYRAWSGSYDQPGNPLIAVEEPVVRQIVADLPRSAALDAACGTGRYTAILAAAGHRVTVSPCHRSRHLPGHAERCAP